jgi:hypothetical protein
MTRQFTTVRTSHRSQIINTARGIISCAAIAGSGFLMAPGSASAQSLDPGAFSLDEFVGLLQDVTQEESFEIRGYDCSGENYCQVNIFDSSGNNISIFANLTIELLSDGSVGSAAFAGTSGIVFEEMLIIPYLSAMFLCGGNPDSSDADPTRGLAAFETALRRFGQDLSVPVVEESCGEYSVGVMRSGQSSSGGVSIATTYNY